MTGRHDAPALHAGAALVELHLPGVSSLKEKRGLVKHVTAAIERELGASVAEVGWQDRWQRAALGVAIASSNATGVDRVLERLVALCERDPRIVVTAMYEHLDRVEGSGE